MTTLTVALISSVMAFDVQAPRPNPNYPSAGCRTAWDCVGDSVYCYEGNPNYCAYGHGIGSLCEDDSGCGWLGYGSSARKMRCRFTWRRADVGVAAPRPRPPTRGYCYDPGFPRTYGGRRLNEETDSNDSLDEETDSNNIQDSKEDSNKQDSKDQDSNDDAQALAPAKAQDDDSKDGNGQGSGMSTDDDSNDDTDDNDEDRRRQGDGTVRAPNPQGNTRCRDAFDCEGVSVYCYAGRRGNNYCEYGDGVGSLCRNHAGCGWIGRGNNARKMRCDRSGSSSRGRCRDPWGRRN